MSNMSPVSFFLPSSSVPMMYALTAFELSPGSWVYYCVFFLRLFSWCVFLFGTFLLIYLSAHWFFHQSTHEPIKAFTKAFFISLTVFLIPSIFLEIPSLCFH